MVLNIVRNYDKYGDYINHQKEKSCDPKRIKKWLNDEWRSKIEIFKDHFKCHVHLLSRNDRIACLAARTGQEVVAFQELGFNNCVGMDIVAYPPLVIEGDFHNLPFQQNTLKFIYSNSFDHSLYPQKFAEEIEKVLLQNGYVLLHLQVNIKGDKYSENLVSNINDVVSLFKKCSLLNTKNIKDKNSGMNKEILLIKNK